MIANEEVVVIGAGLLGLSTASALEEAGFSVTVIEKNDAVATGASFANGGMLTPSMSEPWNAPGVHWQLLRHLGRSDAPMLLRISALHHYVGWGLRFLRNTSQARFEKAARANMALSLYSVSELGRVRDKYRLSYDQATNGTLKTFRSPSAFSEAQRYANALGKESPEFDVRSVDEVVAHEPALRAVKDKLAGGIFYPGDELGDARIFCEQLLASLGTRHVHVSFSESVQRLLVERGRVIGLLTDKRELRAEKVVNCTGVWSDTLSRTAGLKLHVKPVKGYSVTAEVSDIERLPRTAILDDEIHAAVVPLGGRVRLAGTAEFCGWSSREDPARVDNLWYILSEICPDLLAVSDRESAKSWCGLRPMSADGCPYIGETPIAGLYVNTGHGPLGWTQASGSAALLASLLRGKPGGVDADLFSPGR